MGCSEEWNGLTALKLVHFEDFQLIHHFMHVKSTARPAAPAVPTYHLYGEAQWLTPEMIHVESIAARSRLHNWEIKPHRHHGLFQMLWLQQGTAELMLDEAQGQLQAGSVLLVPQHCVHGFHFSKDASGVVVTLAYAFFTRLGTELNAHLNLMQVPRVCALEEVVQRLHFESLLNSLQDEYTANQPHRGALIESLMLTLLIWLLRPLTSLSQAQHGGRSRHYLTQFSVLIDRDFVKHLPLEHYAEQLGISAAHLNALCRQLAGCSALELVHARLMLEAKRNLVYTAMSVRDIADLLGFSDPAYFTRFFKRSGGMSPREFRQHAVQLAS